jgi:hypothetical protein
MKISIINSSNGYGPRWNTLNKNDNQNHRYGWNKAGAKFLAALVFAFCLTTTMVGNAQESVGSLDQLEVALWPDFDDSSVLVLLTGTLPGDIPLPATVTIPVPTGARINAVARMTPDGNLIDDIAFNDDLPGQLTLTTPERRFHTEYYIPYEADGNKRNHTFNWNSELTINEFQVSVQQPSLAQGMTLSPNATNLSTGAFGLQYHFLEPRSLASGDSFTLDFNYELARPQLSVEVLETQPVDQNAAAQREEGGSDFDYALAIGIAVGGIALAVAFWFVMNNRRPKRRTLKPKPTRRRAARRIPRPVSKRTARPTPKGQIGRSNFCHACGQPADPDDRFCSKCGTALKGM